VRNTETLDPNNSVKLFVSFRLDFRRETPTLTTSKIKTPPKKHPKSRSSSCSFLFGLDLLDKRNLLIGPTAISKARSADVSHIFVFVFIFFSVYMRDDPCSCCMLPLIASIALTHGCV
jgi:hypothetical protein